MRKEKTIQGIGVSTGVVRGRVYLFTPDERDVRPRRLPKSSVPAEVERFQEALIKARQELVQIQKDLAQRLGRSETDLFDAHLLVVEDRTLIEEVIRGVEERGLNVEFIFQETIRKYEKVFSQIRNDYIRDRLSDIKDVAKRVMRHLTGKARSDLSSLSEEVIVIAHDISPSDTALMHKENVIGFATDVGGRTSHTAIMARSLGIPAVVGLGKISSLVEPGDEIVVDGSRGLVVIHPSRPTLRKIEKEKEAIALFEKRLRLLKDLPAETRDGFRVILAANIEMPEDLPSVISHGAEGIGLYRTEFLYLNRDDLPTEEEQFRAYREVAEKAAPHSVIIRTLDLGGDKFLSPLGVPGELNPFLGWRGIRFCLQRKDIFRAQLRAILRASVFGRVKIMFPMVSGLSELRSARSILKKAMKELDREKADFNSGLEVGVMIEVPSAALTADILAPEVDFFSIGTNDLIQYALAVDRVNEKIAHLYQPLHPGVLRLLEKIITAAHRNHIWVGMCGEMAGDLTSVPILLGMGIDELSVSPMLVPEVKKLIRSLNLAEARKLAGRVIGLTSSRRIETESRRLIKKAAPMLLHREVIRL